MHFNLDVPRQYFGLLIHREWAFLIGGNEDNSVEKINLQTGEKKSMAVLLNIGAGGKHILKAKWTKKIDFIHYFATLLKSWFEKVLKEPIFFHFLFEFPK